jgi:hypothetical protein
MRIATKTIEVILPIIEAIDKQLAMAQDDRKNFLIETDKIDTLKNTLVAYKTNFKKEEWNGRFFMTKQRNKGLYIDFRPKNVPKPSFANIAFDEEPVASNALNFTIMDTSAPEDGVAVELNDNQLSQELLMENPSSIMVLLASLSDETRKYFRNPLSEPPSALVNLFQKRGYKYQLIQGTKVRIFTGS